MAAYDLEEQEKLDEIKTWWKIYGNLVLNVATGVAVAFIAWQGWNWYQRNQSAQASQLFGVLQQAVGAKDSQRAKAASGELLEKFGGTSYASLAALTMAKFSLDNGDAKTARLQLQWVVTNGADELREIARLRLSMLLVDEKDYAEALKVLDGKVEAGFAARFADQRGDVFAAQGKKAEAVAAYKDALATIDKAGKTEGKGDKGSAAGSPLLRQLVEQKLEAFGGAAQ